MPRAHEDDEDDDFEDDDEGAVDEFVGAVFEHPRVSGVITKVSHTLDRLSSLIDQVSNGVPRGAPRSQPRGQAQPRRQAPPPPPPAPPPKVRIDPYVVMGFARDKPLTEAMIKDRRRQLAKIFHTDHAGNDESMKRVNVAAELLLQKIGARKAP